MKRLILALLLLTSPAFAYDEGTAQDVILSTANDRPYEEMYALACAIRNRKEITGGGGPMLADVSACTAEQRALVKQAWEESENGEDVTEGANRWTKLPEGGNFIGRPKPGYSPYARHDGLLAPWMAEKYKTKKVGLFQFYKAGDV